MFGISINDSAHVMTILRDTMYSDKVLAILREYGANAWDAHRMAGKETVPIKVTLPTAEDPTLSIRDFGPGLSRNDVFKVYTQYGASTKRDSDTAVGMLGIGSKSGFAYSDSFTVVSFHGGTKSSYVAVLDQSERGVINLLDEQPCGEETGVLIQIAARHQDLNEFIEKAGKLFKYFNPRPEINMELENLPKFQASLKKGVIFVGKSYYERDSNWEAIMGCVPYRIDLKQLVDSKGESQVSEALRGLSGILYFDIGEIQINASREGLRYTDATKATIIKKFNDMVDEYVELTIKNITSKTLTAWQKRVSFQIFNTLNLPIPNEWKKIACADLKIKDLKLPPSFVFATLYTKKEIEEIEVNDRTRLILRDDNRPVNCLPLSHGDYFVKRTSKDFEWVDVKKDLEKFCDKFEITGIPIIKCSELTTGVNYVPKIPVERLKGKIFLFVPNPKKPFNSPLSPHWKPLPEHTPTDSDIVVTLRAFRPSTPDFFVQWEEDKLLCELFNFTMPTLIGYRNTKLDPVVIEAVPGKSYDKWSAELRAKIILIPEVATYTKMLELEEQYGNNGARLFSRKLENIVNLLGDEHRFSKLIKKRTEVTEYFRSKWVATHEKAMQALFKGAYRRRRFRSSYGSSGGSSPEFRKLSETYRLFESQQDPLTELLDDRLVDHWLIYIKAVDTPTVESKAP